METIVPYLRRCDTISIFSYDFIELKTMKTTRDKFAFLAIVVADFFFGRSLLVSLEHIE